ncbi:MAG: VOC family protein [Planctomycetota bacterium]
MSQNPFGHFVWHDCMSKDPARSKAFYSELFGWRTQAWNMGEMVYEMLKATDDEADLFGGLNKVPDENMPSHWISYLSVEDIDAATARAEDLGATVLHPPTEIPTVGRFSIIQDPAGAAVALYRSDNPQPPRGMEQMKPGLPCWMELITHEPEKAIAFYGELCGWTNESKDMGSGMTYHTQRNGDAGIGGVMKAPMAEIPSHWYPYFLAGDLATTHARALELGATQIMPPTDIGEGMGAFSVLHDPTGAVIGLYGMPDRKG